MLSRFDTQTLEAIHQLNTGSNQWLIVIASIERDRDILLHKLINCNDEAETRIYQGQLRWVNDFLSTSGDASTTLQKRKEIK